MFKKQLIAGLLIWVPLGATILVINFLLNLFDRLWVLVPIEYRPETYIGMNIPGLSVIIAFLVIFITGIIFSNYFGNHLVRLWEKLLHKIPVVRIIYRSFKQMTEAIFTSDGRNFSRVFLVEYPRKHLWTVAFETSNLTGEVHHFIEADEAEEKHIDSSQYINLFVPTTPNPTSGYFIIASRSELILLSMGVDEALKMIVSGGVYIPEFDKKTLSEMITNEPKLADWIIKKHPQIVQESKLENEKANQQIINQKNNPENNPENTPTTDK